MKVREPNTYRFTPKGLKAYRRGELGTDRDLIEHIVSVILSGYTSWGLPERVITPILHSWTRKGYISTDPPLLSDLEDFYNKLDKDIFGKNIRFSRKSPEVIYCTTSGPSTPYIVKGLGYRLGARLPTTIYPGSSVYFTDQNWKDPVKDSYISAVKEHKPYKATVLDATSRSTLREGLKWGEEIAPYVEEIIVIPKYSGAIKQIPELIKGKRVLLGDSIPTTYGSSDVPLREYGDRPVHLLGGQPHTQMDLVNKINVESVDFNSISRASNYGHSWVNERVRGSGGRHEASLAELKSAGLIPDYGDTNIPSKALLISLLNVRKAWEER